MSGDDEDRAIDELVEAVGRSAPTSPASTTDAAPDEPRSAAVALVGALRRRRTRAAPPREEAMADLARAVHRLRVGGSPEEILRIACPEAARVTGLERVTLSALSPDGALRMLHGVGGGPTRTGAAAPPSSPPESRLVPGSPEATAVRTREPVVTGTTVPRAPSAGRYLDGGPCAVVPILRAGAVVGLFHGAHRPPRGIDARRVAGLAAFAAVFAPVWHSSAIESRWAERAAELYESVEAAIRRSPEEHEDELDLGPRDEEALDAERPGPDGRCGTPARALTPRERVVLDHILAGAGNREIADALVLTVDTVKTHVKKILRKLGAVNRADLIARSHRGAL